MTQQLFIPEKIRVGYQSRKETYTQKLAYVIYYDQKGKLRKEDSWQNWRDKELGDNIFDNTPTEGFVLNKGVGGKRDSYGWNSRNEYIRVYDPRDFEFEISVANLLFILRECDCNKGKGLEGKFVYAWDGKELVLLPEACNDFQSSKNYTKLQNKKINVKELVAGAVYITKKQRTLIYIGKLDYHLLYTIPIKKHVFWAKDEFLFLDTKDLKILAERVGDNIVDNFAELAEKYYKSPWGSVPVALNLKTLSDDEMQQYSLHSKHHIFDNCYIEYIIGKSYYDPKGTELINIDYKISMQDKTLSIIRFPAIAFANAGIKARREREYQCQFNYYSIRYERRVEIPWFEPNQNQILFVTLESGSEFPLNGKRLIEKTNRK